MTPFSIRTVQHPTAEHRTRNILSIHMLHSDISSDYLDGAIAHAIANGIQFDAIHFVGTEDCMEQAREWLSTGSSIAGRLDLATVDLLKSVRLISFDEVAGKHVATYMDGTSADDYEQVIDAERKYTLHSLFIENNGYMQAPDGFHYIKPSKAHANAFLRTSNVLEDHAAAPMIAFWLFPHVWKKPIQHIVVDTSGISTIAVNVAYEAVLRGGLKKPPLVSSHQSYGGLDRLKITRPSETLLLISASTSGALKKRLQEKGAEENKIITLFYLGEKAQEAGYVLCDLTKESHKSPVGFDSIVNHEESHCPYCIYKSYPVNLGGDQFSFEPPKVEEIHITITDLPRQQQAIIDQLAGLDFFKVYRNLNDRNLEIYLDVSALLTNQTQEYAPTRGLLERLRRIWKGAVLRGAPLSLKRIVTATYPFSNELAESAEGILREHQKDWTILNIHGRSLRSSTPDPGSASLVVVSCLDDSHELMSINRDLRHIQPHGNTSYLTPVFRASSRRERERIKSNLTYGENGANTFSLYSIIEIDLPEDNKEHSWKTELSELNKIVDWADLSGFAIPGSLMDRIQFLQEAPSEGISEQLFWPNCQGKALKIRSDFTLMNTEGGTRNLSQADIFVVISAVLHNLRQGIKGKPKLAYKAYERGVLSPDNFERFNDGIIHAAILRSVRGHELAYANCDYAISHRMSNFIISHIEKAQDGEGEALMEFLLALVSRRLTLWAADLLEITTAIQKQHLLGSDYQMFAKYLSDTNHV